MTEIPGRVCLPFGPHGFKTIAYQYLDCGLCGLKLVIIIIWLMSKANEFCPVTVSHSKYL